MSKAILAIDMPNCCDECFALDDNGDYPFCLITQEQRGYTFRTREQRMDKCPFRSMPEKKLTITSSDYLNGFGDGYNACIDDLTNN